MENSPKLKWKRGLTKMLSGGGSVNSVNLTSSFISESEELDGSNEMEIEAYYQNLKSKTSVKNLWGGDKFSSFMDDDITPDVSTDSDSQLDLKMSTTLKNLHLHPTPLDSDEDEMRIDYARETPLPDIREDVEQLHHVDSSDDGPGNMMNNIHFAELELGEVDLSDDLADEKPKDFLPRLFSADVVDVASSPSSKTTSSFKPLRLKSRSKSPKVKSQSNTTTTIDEVDDVISDVESIRSSYTNDVVSEVSERIHRDKNNSDSDTQTYSYSQSFSSSSSKSSKTNSNSSQRTNSSRTRSQHTNSVSDNTVDTSKSTSSESSKTSSKTSRKKKNESKRKKDEMEKGKSKSVETQTNIPTKDDMTAHVLNFRYDWQLGGRSKIASHVINPETVDVLTNFNPCVLAAHDLMKYHFRLLRQQIDDSRRLYEAYANDDVQNNHSNSYKYTTVEDTKKYLKEHSPKVISYEEALRQVQEECYS